MESSVAADCGARGVCRALVVLDPERVEALDEVTRLVAVKPILVDDDLKTEAQNREWVTRRGKVQDSVGESARDCQQQSCYTEKKASELTR
eukprot:2503953-Pleurochrysis_carterae.AAC.1